jgi:ribosomal protein S17E
MTKEHFDSILLEQKNIKNIPNSKLIEYMDVVTEDFETTKSNLINMSYYLDKLEELYNSMLKEYQSRNNE